MNIVRPAPTPRSRWFDWQPKTSDDKAKDAPTKPPKGGSEGSVGAFLAEVAIITPGEHSHRTIESPGIVGPPTRLPETPSAWTPTINLTMQVNPRLTPLSQPSNSCHGPSGKRQS